MFQYYDTFDRYNMSTVIGKEMYIKGGKIDEFFNMLPNKNVLFHCYEYSGKQGIELCNVTDEELKITYNPYTRHSDISVTNPSTKFILFCVLIFVYCGYFFDKYL